MPKSAFLARFISGFKVGLELDWDDCWIECCFGIFGFMYIWNWPKFVAADVNRASFLLGDDDDDSPI